MDIKNIFDFESKVNFLTESYTENISDNIKHQNSFMNSEIANNNFTEIENNLNALYERIRVLEELIDYAKIYVNNEIDGVITECRGLLNEIENMNDMHFNDMKNYTVLNVPLINNDSAQYTDRDGTSLETCEIYNNIISLSGTVKDIADIKTVSVSSTEQVYENNPDDLVNNNVYRSHYLLDNVASNGVTETITISFGEAKNINSIKIKLSNCNAYGIIYVHEDNTETNDTIAAKGIIPAKTVKAIKLLINSSNYVSKIITVNATAENKFDMLDKAWNEYHETIKEQDIINSQNEYKAQMSAYLDEILKGGIKYDK